MTMRIATVFGTVGLAALASWAVFRTEPAMAAKPTWMTDMKQAQELAAKEKKDVLINFTGSDWCTWCIKLREEVFDKEGFDKALDDYVLVMMDFPSDESIVPPKTRAQNQLWSEKLGIEGFPTVVLTDAEGRPYASMSYMPGGPPAFLTQLGREQKTRVARDENFAKAKTAQGVEKAKLLASALDAIPPQYYLPAYRSEVKEIIALDEKDAAGLKTEYTEILQQAEAQEWLKKLQEEVQLAYQANGIDAALQLVQKSQKTEEAKTNPIIERSLGQAEIQMLVNKAEGLAGDDKLKEAQAVYASALGKTEKGSDEWLMMQVGWADQLKNVSEPKQAAGVYDDILTLKTLVPVQQAMVLVYAAEAHKSAEQLKEADSRVASADKILKTLGDDETLSPELLKQLATRLDAVRKEAPEEKKPAAKEATKE